MMAYVSYLVGFGTRATGFVNAPHSTGLFKAERFNARLLLAFKFLSFLEIFSKIKIREELIEHYEKHLTNLRSLNFGKGASHDNKKALQLADDGFVTFDISKERSIEIKQLLSGRLAAIQQYKSQIPVEKRSFGDSSHFLGMEENADLYSLVNQTHDEINFWKTVNAFEKAKIRLDKIFLQVVDEAEVSSKYGFISDEGLPKDEQRYFHIDSKSSTYLKSLIYLDPVSLHGGLSGTLKEARPG